MSQRWRTHEGAARRAIASSAWTATPTVEHTRVAWVDTDAGRRIHFTAAFRWDEAAVELSAAATMSAFDEGQDAGSVPDHFGAAVLNDDDENDNGDDGDDD